LLIELSLHYSRVFVHALSPSPSSVIVKRHGRINMFETEAEVESLPFPVRMSWVCGKKL